MVFFSCTKALRNCLRHGIGLSICPEVMVRDDLGAGRLAQIPWESDYRETANVMIWHSDRWCSPLLKHFMQIATECMRSPNP
jgi:DNA-binding transcriptional LysR family regulator